MLCIKFDLDPLFLVSGKGPEAAMFAALVNAAGYPNLLLSPDEDTLAVEKLSGCKTQSINKPHFPSNLTVDYRTAIVPFFHDHDWEPEIIVRALNTDAFYIGAQGSLVASEKRIEDVRSKLENENQLVRISGPIGLIPSTRDARTLAVSVLAEILNASQIYR